MILAKKPFFLLLFGFLWAVQAHTQGQVFVDPDVRWYMNQGKSQSRDMVFYYYPYTRDSLDLRPFKDQIGEGASSLPDTYVITPPTQIQKGKAVCALTILQEQGGKREDLVAIFIAKDSLSNLYYFIDSNLDQNYQNDGAPIRMTPNSEPHKVTIKKEEKRSPTYMFFLFPPEPEKLVEEPQKEKPSPWILPTDEEELAKIKETVTRNSRFTLRTNLMYGFERLAWSYLNNSSGYPTTYDVTSSNKAISLQVNYRWRFIRFGIRSSLESLFYWTSHKETRLGEPYEYCDAGGCTYFENVLQEPGKDILPKSRVSAGLNLEFLIPLDARMNLSPYTSLGFSQYLKPQYIPNRFKPEEVFTLNREPYLEAGCIFEFFALNGNSLALQLSWKRLQFSADEYFDSLDISNLQKSNSGFWVSVGYGIGLK